MKKNRTGLLLALGTAAGILLLLLLITLAERNAPGASILTFPTALWYAFTTLTTVGYGDTYPVTPLGRALGILLQLGSLGLLGALLGWMLSFLRGKALPRMRLRLLRGRDWYVFSSMEEPALTLAAALLREDPGRTVILSAPEGASVPGPEGALSLPLSPEEILAAREDPRGVRLFCMGLDGGENEAIVRALYEKAEASYCLSSPTPSVPLPGVRFLDPAECRARLYWDRYPLQSPRETIVLIGEGDTAEALLEEGLLVNLLDDPQRVTYHVFGDFQKFRLSHRFLKDAISLVKSSGEDALLFHEEPWNACPEILERADRVILCREREEAVRSDLRRLRRLLPMTAPVYARLNASEEGAIPFGSPEEIYTPENVMLSRLSRLGVALNNIYRASTGGTAPTWEELGDFARRSNLASADHLKMKLRILLGDGALQMDAAACRAALAAFLAAPPRERERYRRIEHRRWARFHYLNNWQYAPVRDNARWQHPLLIPYEDLDPKEQEKDDYSWTLLGPLAEELDRESGISGKGGAQ